MHINLGYGKIIWGIPKFVVFCIFLKQFCGAVVAQWIRPRTLNREVPGSNLLAVVVVSLGKALYPHCLVLRKDLKQLVPWLLTYKQPQLFETKQNPLENCIYIFFFYISLLPEYTLAFKTNQLNIYYKVVQVTSEPFGG